MKITNSFLTDFCYETDKDMKNKVVIGHNMTNYKNGAIKIDLMDRDSGIITCVFTDTVELMSFLYQKYYLMTTKNENVYRTETNAGFGVKDDTMEDNLKHAATEANSELKDLIKELRGDNDTSFHSCIIAVTKYNGSYIIKSEPSLDDVFDGCDLSDNLTDSTNIPKEEGVYKCQIRYHCYKSHHPLDPVEWDVDVSIVSYEKVVL